MVDLTTVGRRFSWLFGGRSAFSYDALDPRGRRRAPSGTVRHEEQNLTAAKRKRLSATAQDLHRNFAVPAWAIRKHLDYVSRFKFQALTSDKGLNQELEAMVAEKSLRKNCDYAERHPLRRFIRIAEARKVLDGDVGIIKIDGTQGGGTPWRLQAVEQDRIATAKQKVPRNFNPDSWINGVRTRAGGKAEEYCICRRSSSAGGAEFEKIVKADAMLLHASFEGTHRFDQLRGISPFVSALNSMRDVYEGFDYALAKIKLAQLVGLKVTREQETDAVMAHSDDGTLTDDADGDSDSPSGPKYAINLAKGPFHLELDPGEDIDLVESKTPATETVEFLRLIIQVALKALDIPYSFFDESFTNFYGSRGGLIQYLKSCRNKIEDLQDILDDITEWWFNGWIYDGSLVLPRSIAVEQLNWAWVPDGVPWWDPVKEVNGHRASVSAGFDNIQNVCRSIGTDFYENIDRNAEAIKYAADAGITLDWEVAPMTTIEMPQ